MNDEYQIYQIASETLKPYNSFIVGAQYRFFASEFKCVKIWFVPDSNLSLIWIEFEHPEGGFLKMEINNSPDIKIFYMDNDARKHIDEDYKRGIEKLDIGGKQSAGRNTGD